MQFGQAIRLTRQHHGVMDHITHKRLRYHDFTFGIPIGFINTLALLGHFLFGIIAIGSCPGAYHQPAGVGDDIHDPAPTLARRQSGYDSECTGQLAHLRTLFTTYNMIDIRSAAFIPENFKTITHFFVQAFCPTLAALFFQPGGHLSKLVQAARPKRVQQCSRVFDMYTRPIHQIPLDDIFEYTRGGLVGSIPSQDFFDTWHELLDRLSVAYETIQVINPMHPMQRPIGDGVTTICFDIPDHAHR